MSNAIAAAQAYKSNREQTKNFRDLEYDVFLSVTRSLKRLHMDPTPSFPKLAKVLSDNERLWTEIGVQVADKENALPADLRARLFYMAEFVSHQSRLVLNQKSDLSSLIDVNVAILRGLKGKG